MRRTDCKSRIGFLERGCQLVVTVVMTPEHWKHLRELFSVAIERTPAERAVYLDEACAGDPALREELDSLLASYDDAETFIEVPAFSGTPTDPSQLATQIAGRRIGSYELVREIGRGGMGTVYLAERADKQYEKLVAIKVVRRGMDTEDILRRFSNERQILASLDHPNIARLLDGGTTDDGLPYLVMEYVEGARVTDYCDLHRLTTSSRLQIFRTICAAVQHAHQNLVIHRDLKPSNILITPDGLPKLLDFGIAKVFNLDLGDPLTERTLPELRVFTPYYASPEQVRGETLTTTSDIYSLGILLYELLTGFHPYRSRSIPPHELVRVICEQEPPKPSTTMGKVELSSPADSTVRPDITPESVSSARNTQPDKLRRTLAGDLDNIILMALRKEPGRRYASVGQFSEDIRRHLDGLPVVARKDTFKYRATKFVRRNRLGVGAAAVILLTLVGGILATTWQARAARQEKVKAENVSAFLESMLTYSNPLLNSPTQGVSKTTMEEVLDRAAGRLNSAEFANEPEVKAELEKVIAQSYYGQGKQDLYLQHMREYVRLQKSLGRENDAKTIEATATWASLLFADQKLAESEQAYRQVLPLMRVENKKGTISTRDFAYNLNAFGYLRRTQGDSREAEAAFRESLTLIAQLSNEERFPALGLTRSTLASTLSDQGRFDEALATSREAVGEYRGIGRTNTPDFGFVLTILGGFLVDKGVYPEADSTLAEAEALLRKQQGPLSLWLGDTLRNEAISFYRQEKYDDAQRKVTESEKIYLASFGPSYDNYPTVLIVKGLILDKTGKSKEAENILREAVKLRTDSLPKDHFWVAVANGALGECLTTQKRFAEAETLLVQTFESLNAHLGKGDPRTSEALRRLVALYDLWDRRAQSAKYRAQLSV